MPGKFASRVPLTEGERRRRLFALNRASSEGNRTWSVIAEHGFERMSPAQLLVWIDGMPQRFTAQDEWETAQAWTEARRWVRVVIEAYEQGRTCECAGATQSPSHR